MKDFNNSASNAGLSIVAIDALVNTSASKAYIIENHAADVLPIGVQSASYQGQDAAFIRVAVDDAELEAYAASSGGAIEVVELPDTAAARAKFLAQWAKKAATKNKNALLPLLLLPLAACGVSDTDLSLEGVVSAAELIALDAAATGVIDAAEITTLTGLAADVNTVLTSAGLTGLGGEAVTLSDVVLDAETLNTLDGNTTGAIDASTITTLTGLAADVNTALTSAGFTGLGGEAVTLSDVVLAATTLNTLDGNTTGVIDASTITTLTGLTVDLNTAFASAGLTGLGGEAVTLSDVVLDAEALNTLDGNTTGVIDASTITTLTGSAAEIIAILNSGTSIAANINFVIDEDASAADIQTIAAATTGSLTATLASGSTLIDLSSATSSAMSLTVNGDGVTFLSTSDFGGAAVTVTGTGKASFQEGVNLVGTTFDVEADALLELTVSQIDTVSQSGTITGAGDVQVIIADPDGAGAVADSINALINVDLEGGTLTFDLLDDLDTLVLKAGSSIDLGGGDLVIDDGTVDILTNAADFLNVGSVIVNSGLTLSVSQLQQLSGKVETQGEGRLDVKVTSAEDVAALESIVGSLVTAGSVPQISVGVSASVTDTDLQTAIDSELDSDFATAISAATGANIPVTNSQNVALNVGPTLSLDTGSDTGAIDGRSAVDIPVINVVLPFDGSGSLVQDGDELVIYVGGTEVHRDALAGGASNTAVTLALGDIVEGSNLISAAIVRGETSVVSNEMRYILDTIAPLAPTVVGINTISDGVMNAADADGVFIRVNLPDGAAKGGTMTLKLGTEIFGSASVGASQLSDGYVDFFATQTTLGSDGVKTFTAVLTDAVGNVGTASESFVLTLDTTAAAPGINTVAENDVINIGEETSIISGTTEAGSSVSVVFGSVTKAATVDGTSWSYQLTTDDIAAMGQGAETIAVTQTDAAGNVSTSAQKTISIDTVASLTLTATLDADSGTVTFSGTSSGALAIAFENGTATFTQGSATASTTITAADLQALTLTFAETTDSAVTLDLTGSGVPGEFVLQTSFLDEITLTGELGDVSVVRLQVTDSDVNSQELVSFKIDTSGVTGSSAQLIFDLPESAEGSSNPLDNDTIILSADSVISSVFSTVSVDDGALDATASDSILVGGQNITIASTLTILASDLAAEGSVSSIDESGTIVVVVDSEAELSALYDLLSPNGVPTETFKIIGAQLVVRVDGDSGTSTYYSADTEDGAIYSTTDTADFPGTEIADPSLVVLDVALTSNDQPSLSLLDLAVAIDPVVFPGIPTLTQMVDDLQTDVDAAVSDIATNLASIGTLQTNLDVVEALVGSTSVASQIASAQTTLQAAITTVAT
ncbi:beta strand repeat-containing protein, partial [Planktotalea arctica]|uniref:beta strand repeat-containing protein n=1 Tax=Planktotalea arctica TaxID=1481893 RepID=UPI00111C526E